MSSPAIEKVVGVPAVQESGKLGLLQLVALVIGSMIGGGVFNLPSDMSAHASPGAVILGRAITAGALFAIYELIVGHNQNLT